MTDCPHTLACPGCTQQGVLYDQQLRHKQRRLLHALRPFAELNNTSIAPIAPASPTLAYRTRAKWIVGPEGSLGLFARDPDHQVVDLPHCQVVAPPILRVGQLVREALASPGWLRKHLRAVDLREISSPSGSGVLLTLIVQDRPPPSVEQARSAAAFLAARSPEILGIALNLVSPFSPQVLGPTTLHLHGLTEADDLAGASLVRATFGSFTQAHRGQAAALQRAITELARGPVLELYGGSGAIGLTIARTGIPVDSVESFAPASQAAAKMAARERLPFRAITGDAVEVVSRLAREGTRYDLVVVNPPRRGLAPSARKAIAALAPRAIAYVSCEPRTLARDLAHLARLGYPATRATPYDMIPQTDEVEVLVLLEQGSAPPPVVLLEVGEAMFLAREAHTPQEGATSLAARGRALPGCEQAVLVGPADPEGSGISVMVRKPESAGAWRTMLENSHWWWVAWVRGVTRRAGHLGSEARYRRRKVHRGHSLLEIEGTIGKEQTIRARLAGLGHPVLGDTHAGDDRTNRYFFEKFGLDRPFWHGFRVTLRGPTTLQEVSVGCPWPADLLLPGGPEPG
ncbi:MAG: hypothetical protein RMJ98_17930 [Myxococcales bacterium]|nr:RsmD family RNA methyltransferase [Polyangiaceae bacterium]MDW8251177.1 hypothetical protein [Myxococcales bacterium]